MTIEMRGYQETVDESSMNQTALPSKVLHELKALESTLHHSVVSQKGSGLSELLHEDFLEFGRSGQIYTKVDILTSLHSGEVSKIWAQDFALKQLAPGVALLTYKSAQLSTANGLERHTLRSSIWKLTQVGWQLIFHQGTATEPFVQNLDSTGDNSADDNVDKSLF